MPLNIPAHSFAFCSLHTNFLCFQYPIIHHRNDGIFRVAQIARSLASKSFNYPATPAEIRVSHSTLPPEEEGEEEFLR
jgi:hypothetical protein